VNTILTAPIIQFEYETDCGTARGPVVAPVIPQVMMRELRVAYRNGTVWADRGRIVVLIEDPVGVLPTVPGSAK